MPIHTIKKEKDSEKIIKGTQRIEALADGIFSIILTLMVFDMKVPQLSPGDSMDDYQLWIKIYSMWPQFLTFVFSFVILGCFWMGHKSHMNKVERTNRPYEFLNILFFFCVCLIPVGAITLSKYPMNTTAVLFYSSIVLLAGMVFMLKWHYAVRHELYYSYLSAARIRGVYFRTLVNPICVLLAILVSFVDPRISYFFFLLPILYFIYPETIDTHINRITKKTSHSSTEK